MKKNSKALAFLLTLLLLFTFPVAVFAEEITGESTVETVAINVTVPTNLNFALDPLGLTAIEGSQVTDTNYYFINQTFAPVKIEIDLTATLVNDATLVASTSAITGRDDDKVESKKMFFGALGADSLTGDITVTPGAISTDPAIYLAEGFPTGVYSNGLAAETLVPFTPAGAEGTSGSAVIGFALGAATEAVTDGAIASLAEGNDGVAAFQFYSYLNTYAPWEDGDISVAGNYTLIPLRGETYDTYVEQEVGLNQYIVTPPAPAGPLYDGAGFIVDGETVTSITGSAIDSSKSTSTAITIPFYFDGKTITNLKLGVATNIPSDEYEISGDNLVLIKESPTCIIRGLGSTGNKTMTLTLSGDETAYTFVLNITE